MSRREPRLPNHRGSHGERPALGGPWANLLWRTGTIMKRWKQGLVWLALVASGLVGCKQQLFITEPDYEHYKTLVTSKGLAIPGDLDTDPTVTLHPGSYSWPKPPTVQDPDRPPRYMSLAEALAMAIEQGNVG